MEEPTPDDDVTVAPLAGFTVGITAARRAEELRTMLERRGAAVLHGPALRLVPLADDVELRAATEDLIARPPHVTLATTGIGFRSWIEAADAWGLGDGLLRVLRSSELIARGPKARGAIRASWLTEAWSPASESTTEVVEHLLARGVAGVRIAVQLHGEPLPSIVEALEAAGAEVVELPVYRWAPPADLAPVDRLTDAVLGGCVDVMAFTSAPAAAGLLRRAATRGVGEALVTALRGPVLALCVGPVTAGPLTAVGVPTVRPERSRLGAMVRTLEAETQARAPRLSVAGRLLELRGQAVLVDGALRPVAPAGMALLRALCRDPGRVVARAELLRVLPGGGADEHAVETAMTRLRAALGHPALVRTVVKRGYRLACDQPAQGDAATPPPSCTTSPAPR